MKNGDLIRFASGHPHAGFHGTYIGGKLVDWNGEEIFSVLVLDRPGVSICYATESQMFLVVRTPSRKPRKPVTIIKDMTVNRMKFARRALGRFRIKSIDAVRLSKLSGLFEFTITYF